MPDETRHGTNEFQIDETSYESIVKQIRDNEFNKQISEREKQYKKPKIKKHKPFNPWITKYFDLTGNGIEKRDKNER